MFKKADTKVDPLQNRTGELKARWVNKTIGGKDAVVLSWSLGR